MKVTKAFVKIQTLCEQNIFQNHETPASLENICDEIKIEKFTFAYSELWGHFIF